MKEVLEKMWINLQANMEISSKTPTTIANVVDRTRGITRGKCRAKANLKKPGGIVRMQNPLKSKQNQKSPSGGISAREDSKVLASRGAQRYLVVLGNY